MTFRWRSLLAAALLAGAVGPAVPASASQTCTYYHYNASRQRWERVALLVDDEWFQSQPGNQRYESWECKYCVPALTWHPTGGGGTFDEATAQAGQAATTVTEAVTGAVPDLPGGDPLHVDPGATVDDTAGAVGVSFSDTPECPTVPPEDDAIEILG